MLQCRAPSARPVCSPAALSCIPRWSRARPRQAVSASAGPADGVVFCDDAASVLHAVAGIRDAGACVLDCEGHDLGDAAGRMTLVQIIPINPRTTQMSFLVDVLALDTTQPKTALEPLKRVLEDPSITKVLYDCRNDAGALWREQRCRLQDVLDLQLLDPLVWESGASEQQRLLRLKGYMKINTEKVPWFYKNVYQLSGWRGALIANKVALSPQLQEHLSAKKSKPPGWSEAWLHRPLDPQLLEYAVYDVASILALYQHFKDAGWVDRLTAEVRAGSTAYANLYVTGSYDRSNPFQNHPLLPFNVLSRLSPDGSGQRKLCIGCERHLQKQCFNKGKKLCYVCGCVDNRIRRGLK